MMTSKDNYSEVFVWIWLPEETEPVVAGNEASQAMLISGSTNLSRLKTCLETAHSFLLFQDDARTIFAEQREIIKKNWNTVCDESRLSKTDERLFWGRQFLNPFIVE